MKEWLIGLGLGYFMPVGLLLMFLYLTIKDLKREGYKAIYWNDPAKKKKQF